MEKIQTINSIRDKHGFEPLDFDQILYNEPIFYLEQKWNRKLTDHEKHIVIEVYRWTRTNTEAEELKILDTEWIDINGKPWKVVKEGNQ